MHFWCASAYRAALRAHAQEICRLAREVRAETVELLRQAAHLRR